MENIEHGNMKHEAWLKFIVPRTDCLFVDPRPSVQNTSWVSLVGLRTLNHSKTKNIRAWYRHILGV